MSAETVRCTGAGRAKVSPVKLAHVLFLTRALAPMRDWYLKVLDGRVVFQNEALCFLTYDDEHHRVAIVALSDLQERDAGKRAGVDHVAFTYRSLGDLLYTYRHTYRRLKHDGIEPYWCINHGPTISTYYRDLDGNQIELQIDTFATADEADAFIAANFKENPVGVIIDPEELIAHYEAGVPFHELRRRPGRPLGTCSRYEGLRRVTYRAAGPDHDRAGAFGRRTLRECRL